MDRCKRHKWGLPSGFMNTINRGKAGGTATSRRCEVCGTVGWFRLTRGRVAGRIS